MNFNVFLIVFAASLGGAIIGAYLTRGLRAKKEKLIPEIRLPKQAEQNLTTFFVMLATFTLIIDANAVFDLGWNLSLFSDHESKYGFLLGVLVAIAGKQYFEGKNTAVEVAKDGS